MLGTSNSNLMESSTEVVSGGTAAIAVTPIPILEFRRNELGFENQIGRLKARVGLITQDPDCLPFESPGVSLDIPHYHSCSIGMNGLVRFCRVDQLTKRLLESQPAGAGAICVSGIPTWLVLFTLAITAFSTCSETPLAFRSNQRLRRRVGPHRSRGSVSSTIIVAHRSRLWSY